MTSKLSVCIMIISAKKGFPVFNTSFVLAYMCIYLCLSIYVSSRAFNLKYSQWAAFYILSLIIQTR